ncbi:MAG: hypothetical protein HQ515_10230 [Phycisphaeraceae bacterium]|nr:hypothetical protein [Phycisphaeraceae bacterium]
MTSLLRTLTRSVGSGILVWLIGHAILLPVVDVSDGQGHGPDIGSGEWHSAIAHQTKKKKRDAAVAGMIGGCLMLPASVLAEGKMKKCIQGNSDEED